MPNTSSSSIQIRMKSLSQSGRSKGGRQDTQLRQAPRNGTLFYCPLNASQAFPPPLSLRPDHLIVYNPINCRAARLKQGFYSSFRSGLVESSAIFVPDSRKSIALWHGVITTLHNLCINSKRFLRVAGERASERPFRSEGRVNIHSSVDRRS